MVSRRGLWELDGLSVFEGEGEMVDTYMSGSDFVVDLGRHFESGRFLRLVSISLGGRCWDQSSSLLDIYVLWCLS